MTSDECRVRFMAAVRAARRGDHRLGNQLIRDVRQRHGDKAAEIQRHELRNYVNSEKKA